MIMELFKHALYINLESRPDRREHVETELKKMNIHAERMNAIKMAEGAIGCTLSHIRCLELAKERQYPHVFIVEDDITFLQPELLLENLKKFEENVELQRWDVLIIGGNNCPPYTKVTDYCIRAFNNQTTTGYIVKSHYYDTLIANFKESAQMLMRNPHNKREFALDMYWKRLQQTGVWLMIIPATVTQYQDYSDIEKRVVNYDHLMLDIQKDWLFRR
jgi:GR25 family glycosyltransferase involved in LPS biosynthesis